MFGVILTSIVVGIVTFAYLFYQPIPRGIEGSRKIRIFLGIYNLIEKLASCAELLGIGNALKIKRAIFNSLAAKAVKKKQHLYGVVAKDDIIAGVPVRIYTPENTSSNKAGLVYMHGGGWVEGNLDIFDSFARLLTANVSSITISIDYRLAPEHPFPAPFEDCVNVTEYVLKNGKEYGIDSSRLAIAGDSAGGQLAAAVSIKLRQHDPPLRAQLLLYPPLQCVDLQTPSYQYNAKHFDGGVLLNRRKMAYFYNNHALGNHEDIGAMLKGTHVNPSALESTKSVLDVSLLPNDEIVNEYIKPKNKTVDATVAGKFEDIMLNPYFNTLLAPDVSGVPEAYIVACQYDILRDDAILYSKKLEKAGVKVNLDHIENGFHGYISLRGASTEVDRAIDRMFSFLKGVLE